MAKRTSRQKRPPSWSEHGLHFFVIHAYAPQASTKYSGAYVTCWVKFPLYEGALAVAKAYIRRDGWRVRRVKDHNWLNSPSDAPRDALRFVREALKSGACIVYHQYPKRTQKRSSKALPRVKRSQG